MYLYASRSTIGILPVNFSSLEFIFEFRTSGGFFVFDIRADSFGPLSELRFSISAACKVRFPLKKDFRFIEQSSKLTFMASVSAPSFKSTAGWFLTVTCGGPFNASINETVEYPGGMLSPWWKRNKINSLRVGRRSSFHHIRLVVELYSKHSQHFSGQLVFAAKLEMELDIWDNYWPG